MAERQILTLVIACWLITVSTVPTRALATNYGATGPRPVASSEMVWRDPARQRELPLRLYLPKDLQPGEKLPLVLFSHGLGGTLRAGEDWGRHWASYGLASLHLQHPGSDASLLRERRRDGAREALSRGANVQQFRTRVDDVRFVLDELARRQTQGEWTQFDLARVGMSGHSFGARTTMALAGERFPAVGSVREARLRAALALSPAASGQAAQWPERFAAMQLPFLSITGTEDGDVLGNGATPENRREPYRHMPSPDKYLLVMEGAKHSDFSGTARASASAAVASAVQAVSTAFWLAHLREDAAAKSWLKSSAVQTTLGARGSFAYK